MDGTHDVGMIKTETLNHMHLAPHDLRIPFDLLRDEAVSDIPGESMSDIQDVTWHEP